MAAIEVELKAWVSQVEDVITENTEKVKHLFTCRYNCYCSTIFYQMVILKV